MTQSVNRMNQTAHKTAIVILAVLISVPLAVPQTGKVVMVIVNGDKSSWPDTRLSEQLLSRLSARNDIKVLPQSVADAVSGSLAGSFSREQLSEAGLAHDCHLVLWVDLLQEELRRETGVTLPLLARQRRVTAVLEADYRVVDCYRGRVVLNETVKLRRYGPSSLQMVDITEADPNLHTPYMEQKRLFDELESEAADLFVSKLESLLGQR